jgi:hypothetical protein
VLEAALTLGSKKLVENAVSEKLWAPNGFELSGGPPSAQVNGSAAPRMSEIARK